MHPPPCCTPLVLFSPGRVVLVLSRPLVPLVSSLSMSLVPLLSLLPCYPSGFSLALPATHMSVHAHSHTSPLPPTMMHSSPACLRRVRRRQMHLRPLELCDSVSCVDAAPILRHTVFAIQHIHSQRHPSDLMISIEAWSLSETRWLRSG